MKKFTLAIALLSGSLFSLGQNNNEKIPPPPLEESNFSFGVTGGFGHSFITPYSDYSFNPSWNAGLSMLYASRAHWGFGADVIYSREGSTLKTSDITIKERLDYIRVPLKAVYFFKNYKADFRPKISLGPTLGFLVNDVSGANASSFDLGANVAAGFNYRLVRAVWLTADVSYYQGFLDTYSVKSYNNLNGNVRIDLGLSFGFD